MQILSQTQSNHYSFIKITIRLTKPKSLTLKVYHKSSLVVRYHIKLSNDHMRHIFVFCLAVFGVFLSLPQNDPLHKLDYRVNNIIDNPITQHRTSSNQLANAI